jgi:hypothetical protein
MKKYALLVLWFLFLSSLNAIADTEEVTAETIIEKNIQAVFGSTKHSPIDNLAIKFSTMFFDLDSGYMMMTADKSADMKAISGLLEPIVSKVIAIKDDQLFVTSATKQNSLEPIEAAEYKCFSRLMSSLFTLSAFKDKLTFSGKKSYGSIVVYLLSTQIEDSKIDFQIRADDFLLNGVSITITDPDVGKKQIILECTEYKDNVGYMLPHHWYISSIGWERPFIYEWKVENIEINKKLPHGFFDDMTLNYGEINLRDGILKANVYKYWKTPRGNLIFETNMPLKGEDTVGFQTRAEITIELEGELFEGKWFRNDNEITNEDSQPGRVVIMPWDADYYAIVMYSEKNEYLFNKLHPLSVIKIYCKK